jgi:hypothetical protein
MVSCVLMPSPSPRVFPIRSAVSDNCSGLLTYTMIFSYLSAPISTAKEHFGLGLQRWAAIENLNIVAQSYNEVGSLAELEHKIAVKTEAGKSAKQSVVELEHRIKDLAEIIKYISTKTTAPIISATKKTKNPDTYFRRYESQIILYGGARRMLEQAGINLKGLNVDKLKAEYQELMKQENLNQYLGQTQPDPAQGQQEKNKNQSL